MSVILAFDTATNACSAALLVNNRVFAHFKVAPREHAAILLPMIDALFLEAGIERSALEAVAFGQGPGSFMGVRIAAGVAQGLAYGLNIPAIPISTLQVIAQTAYEEHACETVLAGWDARMQEMYWGAYQLGDNGLMQRVTVDVMQAPHDVCAPEGVWTACGNAWDVYREDLPKTFLKTVRDVLPDVYPKASAMLPIAKALLAKGDVVNAIEVEPVYLRKEVAHKASP